MNVRRVVTTHSEDGASVFKSDGGPPREVKFVTVPGLEATLIWADDIETQQGIAAADVTDSVASWVPKKGGSRLMLVTFPPETSLSDTSVDPQLMGMEYLEKLPGLAETFDPAEAGMHVTPTLDYGVVLQGEIGLLLDNGEIKHLKQHDVVIQTGTRHAWRNTSNRPATMLFALLGR